jgi:N utilization substance protein B
MSRRQARETALQCLYQMEMAKISMEEALQNLDLTEINEYTHILVKGVSEHQNHIDDIIRPLLKGWKLERLSCIDRTILRIGAFEIMYMEDIPDAVAIDEAVELAKVFGDEKSRKFVNGVLSSIMKEKKALS